MLPTAASVSPSGRIRLPDPDGVRMFCTRGARGACGSGCGPALLTEVVAMQRMRTYSCTFWPGVCCRPPFCGTPQSQNYHARRNELVLAGARWAILWQVSPPSPHKVPFGLTSLVPSGMTTISVPKLERLPFPDRRAMEQRLIGAERPTRGLFLMVFFLLRVLLRGCRHQTQSPLFISDDQRFAICVDCGAVLHHSLIL